MRIVPKRARGPALCLSSVLLVLLLGAPRAAADELHVPGDAPTIQAAVDLAADGDVILLAPGTYTGPGNRAVDFGGKSIDLVGPGPELCVLDAEDADRALLFTSGTGARANVSGLAIRNAKLDDGSEFLPPGQAVRIEGDSVRFTDCVFFRCGFPFDAGCCGAGSVGGAIAVADGVLVLEECVFQENHGYRGGAVYAIDSQVRIDRCSFLENKASISVQRFTSYIEGDGGALVLFRCTRSRISDSIFVGNSTAGDGGAIRLVPAVGAPTEEFDGIIERCTFYDNQVGGAIASSWGSAIAYDSTTGGVPAPWLLEASILDGPGFTSNPPIEEAGSGGPSPLVVRHCNVMGGHPGEGNTDLEPGFVAPNQGDVHLAPDSPLVDALAVDDLAPVLGTDRDGNPRLQDGDLDGVARVDLGAFERTNVELTVQPAGGGSFLARLTGTAGLHYAVRVARELLTPPVFVDGVGMHLVDALPGGPVLLPGGTIPDFVVAPLPPGLPAGTRLLLQPFARDPATGFGNTGNVVELLVE